jgi:hypothetical protein
LVGFPGGLADWLKTLPVIRSRSAAVVIAMALVARIAAFVPRAARAGQTDALPPLRVERAPRQVEEGAG